MVRRCRYFFLDARVARQRFNRLRSFLIVVESPIGVKRRKSEVGGKVGKLHMPDTKSGGVASL